MTQDEIRKIVLDQTKEVATLSASIKSAHRRLDAVDKLTEAINNLVTSLALANAKSENIEKDIKNINADISADISKLSDKVDKLRQAPGEKWKYLINAIITAAVALVVSAAFGAFG